MHISNLFNSLSLLSGILFFSLDDFDLEATGEDGRSCLRRGERERDRLLLLRLGERDLLLLRCLCFSLSLSRILLFLNGKKLHLFWIKMKAVKRDVKRKRDVSEICQRLSNIAYACSSSKWRPPFCDQEVRSFQVISTCL